MTTEITEGSAVSIKVGDASYQIQLLGAVDNSARIVVEGVRKEVVQGNTYSFSGLTVEVLDIDVDTLDRITLRITVSSSGSGEKLTLNVKNQIKSVTLDGVKYDVYFYNSLTEAYLVVGQGGVSTYKLINERNIYRFDEVDVYINKIVITANDVSSIDLTVIPKVNVGGGSSTSGGG